MFLAEIERDIMINFSLLEILSRRCHTEALWDHRVYLKWYLYLK